MNSEPDAGRDGEGQQQGAPRLGDARRAAAALGEAGASRVLVYGSVARGDQHADSDVDLVAIFDDLDYENRWEVKRDLRRRAAEAAGRSVDVHPTDWPEWTMRTENVSSSFEAHIAGYAVVVWDRAPGEVRWGKPMARPASNLEQAAEDLQWVTFKLASMRRCLEGFLERPLRLMAQPRVGWEDHRIIGDFCRDATLVFSRAVSVMVCLRGRYPPRLSRDLDFAGFVAALPPEVRAGCAPWAEEVATIDVSGYESYCGTPLCCFPIAPGSETVEIARTLAGAAARAAIETSGQMRRALGDAGYAGDDADLLFSLYGRTERVAQDFLALLERWDPPITGAAAVAPAEPVGAPPVGD